MPHLARILVYPVKSMEPVSLQQVRVLKSGALEGDRAIGLFDAEGKFVNGKRFAVIHRLRSAFDPITEELKVGRLESGLTHSFHVDRQRESLQEWLSEFFNIPIFVRRDGETGFPDDPDCPGPTVISTATLTEVASWFPPLDVGQLRLRIRANIELGGVPAFWEDHLYGLKDTLVRFRIGDCIFDGNNPCQRCVVPPRDPATGESYPGFAKIFAERRAHTLPPWAEKSRFNHFYRLAVNTRMHPDQAGKMLTVGDEVEILDPK